jgi:hypothetical protein
MLKNGIALALTRHQLGTISYLFNVFCLFSDFSITQKYRKKWHKKAAKSVAFSAVDFAVFRLFSAFLSALQPFCNTNSTCGKIKGAKAPEM